MPSPQFAVHRETQLWSAVEAALSELIATREVSINTAPDYVIAYLCQELVAKKLVVEAALQK